MTSLGAARQPPLGLADRAKRRPKFGRADLLSQVQRRGCSDAGSVDVCVGNGVGGEGRQVGIGFENRHELLAHPRYCEVAHDKGLIVASCKCYGKIKKGYLAEWSDDFLKHWESRWKDKSVLEFVLVVAAPTNSPERMADIEAEKARFARIGVKYSVWSPRQLQEKLRDHPGIVSQYLNPEWEERICGRIARPVITESTSNPLRAELEQEFASLREALSGHVEQIVETASDQLEQGRYDEVEKTLASIRDGDNWAALNDRAKARVLRLQGSVRLNYQDLEGASASSDEADAIALQDEPRLRALIAMYRDGPKAGLQVLGSPTSLKGKVLRTGLLLNAGDLDAVEASLAEFPQGEIETCRLSAYLELFRGRPAVAWVHAQAAEELAPGRLEIARVGAMVRYALALSPMAPAEAMVQPQPVGRMLVRRDDLSQKYLQDAADTFDRLAKLEEGKRPGIMDSTWAMACVANLEGGSEEGERRAAALLSHDPTQAFVIGWALARGFDIDREASVADLDRQLQTGTLGPNGPRALDWLTPVPSEVKLREAVKKALVDNTWNDDVRSELEDLVGRLEHRLSNGKTDLDDQATLPVDRQNEPAIVIEGERGQRCAADGDGNGRNAAVRAIKPRAEPSRGIRDRGQAELIVGGVEDDEVGVLCNRRHCRFLLQRRSGRSRGPAQAEGI